MREHVGKDARYAAFLMLAGLLLAFFALYQSAPFLGAGASDPGTEGAYNERGSFPGFPIDLNTATVEELMVLPGIGEKTARRIVEQRGDGFESVDDLLNVRWIGNKKLDRIRHLVTIKDPSLGDGPEKESPAAGPGGPGGPGAHAPDR